MPRLLTRYLMPRVQSDLKQKMVFLSGPRQVGKTTLAMQLLQPRAKIKKSPPGYYNWDNPKHRQLARKQEWPEQQKLLVFDEVHKLRAWKRFIKGLYDTHKYEHQFLITGSAKLDIYQRGDDSALGRFYSYRLHPLSLNEVGATEKNLNRLFEYGGFPEPYAQQKSTNLKRWHRNRIDQLVRYDLKDLTSLRFIDKIEILAQDLEHRVASPLSFQALAEDLEIDFKTAQLWIHMLERVYYGFSVLPYGARTIRAVKKAKKFYLYDWSAIEEPGIRFENMVACHLLKYCHFVQDTQGDKMELRFLRDTARREVDFIVVKNLKPLFGVECKLKFKPISPHLPYFADRLKINKFYQVHMMPDGERTISKTLSNMPFLKFCQIEKLV